MADAKQTLNPVHEDLLSHSDKPRDCFYCTGDTLVVDSNGDSCVQCPYCGIQGPLDPVVSDAVKAWNEICKRYAASPLPVPSLTKVTRTASPLTLRTAADTLASLVPEGLSVIVAGKAKD